MANHRIWKMVKALGKRVGVRQLHPNEICEPCRRINDIGIYSDDHAVHATEADRLQEVAGVFDGGQNDGVLIPTRRR